MVQSKGKNLVWCKPGSILVDNSKAVRIAIQTEGELGFPTFDMSGRFHHTLGIGLRRFATKERIGPFMETRDLYPRLL